MSFVLLKYGTRPSDPGPGAEAVIFLGFGCPATPLDNAKMQKSAARKILQVLCIAAAFVNKALLLSVISIFYNNIRAKTADVVSFAPQFKGCTELNSSVEKFNVQKVYQGQEIINLDKYVCNCAPIVVDLKGKRRGRLFRSRACRR